MHVKINGIYQVVEMTMTLGLHGSWSVFAQADAEQDISGAITLSIGDVLEFKGTSDRSGLHLGRAKLKVVGGNNGLDTACEGKTYYRAPLRAIIGDLLAIANETLSTLSTQSTLSIAPKHWARAKGTVRGELDVLSERFGFNWRILPDGTFWMGDETWDASPLVDGYQLLRDEQEDGLVEIATDIPMVLPGETFLERRVSEVEHTLNKSLRTVVRFV